MTTPMMTITTPMTDPTTAAVRFGQGVTGVASVAILLVLGVSVRCVTSINIKYRKEK